MLPGSHLIRTTYGPGLLGSPNSTADSLVPAAFLTHLMSAGVLKSTAVRSTSAAEAKGPAIIVARTASTSNPIVLAMPPPTSVNRSNIDPHDVVEPSKPNVDRRVRDQLDDLSLREVPPQLGPERVVDLVMVDGELLREADGRALARAQQVRRLVVDRGDLGLRRARMPGPGIAHGESVVARVERRDLQPDQLAQRGID